MFIKKTFAIFLILNLLFLTFLIRDIAYANAKISTNTILLAQGGEDVEKAIKKGLECGEVGQKCCKKTVNLPKVKFPRPDIPVLDKIIGILATPIETFFSLGDPLFNWTEDKITNIAGRSLCSDGIPSGTKDLDKCICVKKQAFNIGKLCTGIESNRERQRCVSCSTHGVWTAIGCVDYKLGSFVGDIFGFGVGLAGGVAFLCIIYSAVVLQTSRGNPERVKKAREYLTNCIIGLLLIIFSIFILRLIGISILRIPGLGG